MEKQTAIGATCKDPSKKKAKTDDEIATPTIKNPPEGVSKRVLGKKHRGSKKRAGADANVKWLFATESLANEPEAEQVVPLVAPTDISATAGAGVDPLPRPCPYCFPSFGSDVRRSTATSRPPIRYHCCRA